MAEWTYDSATHRYTSGKRVLTEREMLDVRNAIADGMTEESASLARQLLDGIVTLAQWTRNFAKLLTNGIASAFLFGRGGKAAMDETATATLSGLIADQHGYAKGFVKAIAAELETAEPKLNFVAARSELYSGAAVHAFDQGRAQDFGIELPYYPADGGTKCGGNCRCEWTITDTETGGQAVWNTVGDSKVCQDCIDRGNEFGPETPFTWDLAA